MQFKSLYR